MKSLVVPISHNGFKTYKILRRLQSPRLSLLCSGKGMVYSYLGPNGAGKTTTIRTMLGLLKPDQGEVQIADINPTKDPVQALQSLGYARNCQPCKPSSPEDSY